MVAIEALFRYHHSTLKAIVVDEAIDVTWFKTVLTHPMSSFGRLECKTFESTRIRQSTLKGFCQDMMQRLHSLKIGDQKSMTPREIGRRRRPGLQLERLNAWYTELLELGISPLMQSLELVHVPLSVTMVPMLFAALQYLSLVSCPNADELFSVLSKALMQSPGSWLPRLRGFQHRGKGQVRPYLNDLTKFLSSFSGLELLSVVYTSSTTRDVHNKLLKSIISAHGATLKILVWQLRSIKHDYQRQGQDCALQDAQFADIQEHCPVLEEISVSINWHRRYRVSV
jgi:hypothetical protein